MKVLVTGGGGFLGSAICRQLLEMGVGVVAYQRRSAEDLHAAGAEVVQGDITDLSQLLKAAQGCDAVIHTAGKAGIWGDPAEYHNINVVGTQNVIRLCRQLSIPNLVHTSSPSVVHSGGDIENGDESIPLAEHFLSAYPESKAEAEKIVLAENGNGLQTVALRPHLIWGPDDPHILPRLMKKVRGGKLSLPAPEKIIDTIFVENAAQAHVLALLELQGQAKCAGKPYFITNNEPLPQGEIIQSLLAAVGINAEIRAVPTSLAKVVGAICEQAWRFLPLSGEPPLTRFSVEQLSTAHWFNTSAATRDFGYQPNISIKDGLGRLKNSA
ncbi:MAG: NAD-dependent epimerase/dehydratase family protein [Xanthomonadales bacterium]|nr:NAD-dependent epimerase/dehydratase family protein [Xanthomonadales bacterium]